MVGGVAPVMVPDDARMPRVKFVRPVRVTLIDGAPRSYRVQSRNLSRSGIFLEMPMPIEAGTRVALSLEASDRLLPFAQGVVVWQREFSNPSLGRRAGFAVRFTGFLHPRAHELTQYLCDSIAAGRLLRVAKPRSKWRMHAGFAGLLAVVAVGVFAGVNALLGASGVNEVSAIEAPLALRDSKDLAVASPPQADQVVGVPQDPPGLRVPQDDRQSSPELTQSAEPPPPEHSVTLPSGAAAALTWDGAHDEFRVAPTLNADAKTTKIYLLSDPPRLVFDIAGAAPVASHSLASGERLFQRIRVGRQAQATRLVVDLAREPKSFLDEDGAAIVSF